MDAKLIERSRNEPNYRLLAALSIFFFSILEPSAYRKPIYFFVMLRIKKFSSENISFFYSIITSFVLRYDTN